MDVTEPGDVAGMVIEAGVVVAALEGVGCTVDVTGDELAVTAPSWRPDLTDPADLVEEVVRLVGYDQLPSTLPTAPLGGGLTHAQRLRRRVGMALAARGLVEVLSYPFVGDGELDALLLAADDVRRSGPRLANPLSEEQPNLRATLLPGLLAAARRNAGRGNVDLAIFEIGSIFAGAVASSAPPRPSVANRPTDEEWAGLNDLLPHQPVSLAAVFAGTREPQGWWGPARPASWADAVETARTVAQVCGVEVEVIAGRDSSFHPGRCAQVLLDGRVVAIAGELHPRVIESFGPPARAAAVAVDPEAITDAAPEILPAPAVGSQPLAKEDIAVVVDASVPVSSVQTALEADAGGLLESVRLFDVYEGPQVAEGKKSLASALRFRAPDRTLGAEEIAEARRAALDRAAAACGAELRV